MPLSELYFFTHFGVCYSINVNKVFITVLTIILRITRHRKSTKNTFDHSKHFSFCYYYFLSNKFVRSCIVFELFCSMERESPTIWWGENVSWTIPLMFKNCFVSFLNLVCACTTRIVNMHLLLRFCLNENVMFKKDHKQHSCHNWWFEKKLHADNYLL